jgi:hypothetical protein
MAVAIALPLPEELIETDPLRNLNRHGRRKPTIHEFCFSNQLRDKEKRGWP